MPLEPHLLCLAITGLKINNYGPIKGMTITISLWCRVLQLMFVCMCHSQWLKEIVYSLKAKKAHTINILSCSERRNTWEPIFFNIIPRKKRRKNKHTQTHKRLRIVLWDCWGSLLQSNRSGADMTSNINCIHLSRRKMANSALFHIPLVWLRVFLLLTVPSSVRKKKNTLHGLGFSALQTAIHPLSLSKPFQGSLSCLSCRHWFLR